MIFIVIRTLEKKKKKEPMTTKISNTTNHRVFKRGRDALGSSGYTVFMFTVL